MTGITVRPLQDDLPFGSRVAGLTWDNIQDEAVRAQINRVFEDRGGRVLDGDDGDVDESGTEPSAPGGT